MEKQKKNNSHKGHRQRVKAKALQAGIEHWPIHEVLELLLMYSVPQKDVNPLAHTLLDTFGSFAGVLDAGFHQLKKIEGIGDETALYLSLLPDFFVKYTASKNIDSIILDNTYKNVNYFRSIDRVRDRERFYIFCLNGQKKLIKTIKFDSDLSSIINVPITELTQHIVFNANKGILIMHTHPNGNPNPTRADVNATKHIIDLCKVIGIKFEDHIIITGSRFYSFLTSGLLEALNKGEVDLTSYDEDIN